jgi:hypothetical protein
MRSGRTLIQASNFSSLASAASTAAIDPGRPTDSGTIVSGNKVVFWSGRTGITKASPSGFLGTAGSVVLFELFSVSAIELIMNTKE